MKISWNCFLLWTLTLFMVHCTKEVIHEAHEDDDVIWELFSGKINDQYIQTLVYLMEENTYSLESSIALGNQILACNQELACLQEQMSDKSRQDFMLGLRWITLPETEFKFSNYSSWSYVFDQVDHRVDLIYQNKNFTINLDMDNGIDDGRTIGIMASINNQVYQVTVDDKRYNFIKPSEDGGAIEKISVSSFDDTLSIRSIGGFYSNLRDTDDPDQVFFEVKIFLDSDYRPNFKLSGLYYILMHEAGSMIKFEDASGLHQYDVEQGAQFRVYRENVTRLQATDPHYGKFGFISNVQRLQFDTQGALGTFELDFDHTYKDRGQKSAETHLQIDIQVH